MLKASTFSSKPWQCHLTTSSRGSNHCLPSPPLTVGAHSALIDAKRRLGSRRQPQDSILGDFPRVREKDIVTVTISHELEDVVEIFSRLNSRGTRVTEADIYLGMVAAHNPGWVRDTFLPYLGKLLEAGFDLDPNLLFRT